jgi:hypothetical protein
MLGFYPGTVRGVDLPVAAVKGDGRVPAHEGFRRYIQAISDVFAAVIAGVVVPDAAVLDGIYVISVALGEDGRSDIKPYSG